MTHDCSINYFETSEDDDGYLYLEWKRVFGSNTGKIKIEFCPVCGMKAKRSSIEYMTLFPREDIESPWVSLVKELKGFVQRLATEECLTTDGMKCSPQIVHAIIHVNDARRNLEQAIEAIEERKKKDE